MAPVIVIRRRPRRRAEPRRIQADDLSALDASSEADRSIGSRGIALRARPRATFWHPSAVPGEDARDQATHRPYQTRAITARSLANTTCVLRARRMAASSGEAFSPIQTNDVRGNGVRSTSRRA